MKRLVIVAGLAFAVVPTARSQAATATTSFQVTATVTSFCNVAAAPLTFGTYNSNAAANANTTISVTCSRLAPFTIGLDKGAGADASTATRRMTLSGGSDTLNYSLTQDAAHETNWGNASGTDTQAATGTGATQVFTVYGRVAAGQAVTSGSYADTITINVNY